MVKFYNAFLKTQPQLAHRAKFVNELPWAIVNRAKRVNRKQSFRELQAFALRYGKILQRVALQRNSRP